MKRGAVAFALLLSLAPARAWAEEPGGHLTIEAGAGLGGVTHDTAFEAVSLVERLHIGYRIALGLQGGVSFEHAGVLFGDGDDEAELFFLGPEGRYHPFGERCVDPWIGLAFGFASLDEHGPSPWRREKWTGPALLLKAGVLFRVTREVALGVWAGTTFGLWEQTCMLADPYQLDECLGHGDARVTAIGMSIAPRVAAE